MTTGAAPAPAVHDVVRGVTCRTGIEVRAGTGTELLTSVLAAVLREHGHRVLVSGTRRTTTVTAETTGTFRAEQRITVLGPAARPVLPPGGTARGAVVDLPGPAVRPVLPSGGTALAVPSGDPERDARLVRAAIRVRCRLVWSTPERTGWAHRRADGTWRARYAGRAGPVHLAAPVPGRRALDSVALAVEAAELVLGRAGEALDGSRAGRAVASVPGPPGAFTVRSAGGRDVVLARVHDADDLTGLVAAVRDRYAPRRAVWLLGGDRDLADHVGALAPEAHAVVATGAPGPSAVLAAAAWCEGVRDAVAVPDGAVCDDAVCDDAVCDDAVCRGGIRGDAMCRGEVCGGAAPMARPPGPRCGAAVRAALARARPGQPLVVAGPDGLLDRVAGELAVLRGTR